MTTEQLQVVLNQEQPRLFKDAVDEAVVVLRAHTLKEWEQSFVICFGRCDTLSRATGKGDLQIRCAVIHAALRRVNPTIPKELPEAFDPNKTQVHH